MSVSRGASERARVPATARGRAQPRAGMLAASLGPAVRAELTEAGIWLALVAFGLAGTALLASTDISLGCPQPPWHDGWAPRLDPLVAVPLAVAATVIALTAWWASTIRPPRSVAFRLPWSVLLLLGYLGSLAFSLALALVTPGDLAAGLRAPADLLAAAGAVDDDPLGRLAAYTSTTPHAAAGSVAVLPAHPPGPVLATWLLTRAGLHGAVPIGVLFTALGALTVPVVCVAVRSLCHETAARRLVPVLVLAPWSVWMAASPDAVTAALAALAVAIGVIGCEPERRSVWWALASGLLLGLAALFGYAPVWLGVAVAAAYFVRRRPLLNVITGLGALLPLWLFYAWGFSWPDGLALASAPRPSVGAALAWIFLDLTVVVLATGPLAVRAARRLRLTPGWPFLVGATATMLFAVTLGLAEGGAERTWLPVFPWLLVAAVAPRPRPARPGDRLQAGSLPVILVSLSAIGALGLRLCLGGPPA
ncbi:hypothetical protein [Candidatus Frankia alpina]|uniref:hypothetical protein n=1 Tax=Candidatus Frankia alpina TaxID=2699483 RepID=UPI0013D22862|nr:hypothetical protein [Candidatus Frankia alpina]